MAVFNNILAGASGATSGAAAGYEITRSLRFNSADSAYLNRTPSSAGSRTTWTWSGWVKRANSDSDHHLFVGDGAAGESLSDTTFGRFYILSTGQLDLSGYTTVYRRTNALLRDPSAWYHLVCAVDTTISDAYADDRIKLYINGAQVAHTDFATKNNPSQNTDLGFNQTTPHTIGARSRSGTIAFHLDGYLADVHFIDGQALAPTDFGEYDDNNVWQPIEYSGTYGTNGFHLDFSDNSSNAALGTDSSGNSNTWTVNNFSVASGAGNDSLIDTPTNYTADSGNNGGNYCTLNPLDKSADYTLQNGNLDFVTNGINSWEMVRATFAVSSGKWYWEFTAGDNETAVGIAKANASLISYIGADANGWSYFYSGDTYNNSINTAYGASFTTNDVIGVAFDADAGSLYFYKNGTVQNSGTAAFTGLTSGPYFPGFSIRDSGSTSVVNFGQRPFAYTPPTGYVSLCTTNLPDPTIADGSTAMDVALWTGNGSTQTISGLNHSPDFVWHKNRSIADGPQLYDSVRGVSKRLRSDTTAAESTLNGVTAFNSDGWTMTAGNNSGNSYVSWTWDAGSSTVSNTDGSITSSVRANASAGFSCVTWSAAANNPNRIGHGLNAAPEFIIVKSRSNANNWRVYTAVTGKDQYLGLNSTDAASSFSNFWSTSEPTSSTFGVWSATGAANNDGDMVAYCFAPVEGYSAFGSYTGNGSADGPFVFTGMRPRWLLIKESSGVDAWHLLDSARLGYNDDNAELLANNNGAEVNNSRLDFLSNGFKLRTSFTSTNESGATYIYAAFAENPFKTARAR